MTSRPLDLAQFDVPPWSDRDQAALLAECKRQREQIKALRQTLANVEGCFELIDAKEIARAALKVAE